MIRKPGKAIRRGLNELAQNAKTYGPGTLGLKLDRHCDRDKKTWEDVQKALEWIKEHCQD